MNQCTSTHQPPARFTGGQRVTLQCSYPPEHGTDHAAYFGTLRVEWDDEHAADSGLER